MPARRLEKTKRRTSSLLSHMFITCTAKLVGHCPGDQLLMSRQSSPCLLEGSCIVVVILQGRAVLHLGDSLGDHSGKGLQQLWAEHVVQPHIALQACTHSEGLCKQARRAQEQQ